METGAEDSISVLITSYNKRQYILDAVQSARSQSLPGVRIVVVDDGSTDGSAELLQKLRGIDLLSHGSNRGSSAATLTGLRHAIDLGSTFCILLDGDDVLCHNAAEYYRQTLQASGADGVISRPVRHPFRDCRKDVVECNLATEWSVVENPLEHWLRFGGGGTHLCARPELLCASMDSTLSVQDHQLNFSLHFHARRIAYSEAKTHYYSPCAPGGNLSTDHSSKVTSYVRQYVLHHALIKDSKYLKHYTHRAFHKALGARKLPMLVGKPLAFELAALRTIRDLVPHSLRKQTIFKVNQAFENLQNCSNHGFFAEG